MRAVHADGRPGEGSTRDGQLGRGAALRRIAVTVVAGALVVAADIGATLSAGPLHQPSRQRPTARRRASSSAPKPGEPELPSASSVPSGPRSAAVSFVRDYALWSSRRAAAMPGRDTTQRVNGVLMRSARVGTADAANAVASIRIARAPRGTYVVTSAIADFLVGRQRSRWLVISVPGY
jgi:hypothetical protein